MRVNITGVAASLVLEEIQRAEARSHRRRRSGGGLRVRLSRRADRSWPSACQLLTTDQLFINSRGSEPLCAGHSAASLIGSGLDRQPNAVVVKPSGCRNHHPPATRCGCGLGRPAAMTVRQLYAAPLLKCCQGVRSSGHESVQSDISACIAFGLCEKWFCSVPTLVRVTGLRML